MASFAPGTNRNYANAYNNWWFGPGRQGASPAPQRSAFGPDSPPQSRPAGQAQPAQPQGTPYGSPTTPPPTGMVYNRAPSSQPANFSAYQPQQQAPANPFTQYNPQQIGNFVQQQMGLPSFQFTATDSFGNTYNNPAALTAQQGAMAQALNAQRAQQIQSGNIGRLNPMAAYQQAQNMVQGGWTNPFAQPPAQQQFAGLYAPGTDMSTLPFTDTLQPNPLYRPPALPGGQGQAQPIQPPSQGTPYGQPSVPAPQRNAPRSQPHQTSAQPMPFDPDLQRNIDFTLGQRTWDGQATWRSQALQDVLQNVSPNDPAFRQKVMELNPATDTVREVGGRLGQALQASGSATESASARAGREWARNEMGASARARTIAAGRSDSGPPQWEGSRVNGVSSGAFSMGPGGQINFTPAGQAQPIQPPSQGTPYGQSLQASPARPGYTRTPDGRLLYSGQPEVGLQAPPRRGSFERDAVGMPVLRAPNDPSNPMRPTPQPWMTTALGGQVLSMPPRPTAPRRQPFFY